ncbi:MAG TPA: HAMP domain-containing sensor histidine kinase [Pseudomonadota bacterium]|nr:HAMP domain-containing sensor histidine kinase [Pseudomonadota bacterium]
MKREPLSLAARLGISHGVLVAILLLVLIVTLQGLFRMVGLITEISDSGLSSLKAEEQLHRAAWAVELTARHAESQCTNPSAESGVREALESVRGKIQREIDTHGSAAPAPMLAIVQRYRELAETGLAGSTCAYFRSPQTDALRLKLDEELTDLWIDRLHQLHSQINVKEEGARRIGVITLVVGLVIAALAALAAVVIARMHARSITDPIARLAMEATRLGSGDFAPIPPVRGPREVEALWGDLERMRTALLAIEQHKRAFLANVSHELRSPLGRLSEALGLLTDGTCGELNESQARVAELARRACEREVRIVMLLLDMSRLQSGLPIMGQQPCECDSLLTSAIADEQAEASARGVAIELVAQPPSPVVRVDAPLLERAVANLLRNAVSVSSRGQVVQLKRFVTQVEDRRVVQIEVCDQGPGLPPEPPGELFKLFHTARVPGTDRPLGLGIGLPLAREVARAHGGELSLVSTGSSGTTFRLQLPLDSGLALPRLP